MFTCREYQSHPTQRIVGNTLTETTGNMKPLKKTKQHTIARFAVQAPITPLHHSHTYQFTICLPCIFKLHQHLAQEGWAVHYRRRVKVLGEPSLFQKHHGITRHRKFEPATLCVIHGFFCLLRCTIDSWGCPFLLSRRVEGQKVLVYLNLACFIG